MQVPYKVDSGKTPRKLEIERRKRHYAKQSLEELLKEKGVDSHDLIPVVGQPPKPSNSVVHKRATFPPFLPLEIFDNADFDIRTPDEWVALGECVCVVVESHMSGHNWIQGCGIKELKVEREKDDRAERRIMLEVCISDDLGREGPFCSAALHLLCAFFPHQVKTLLEEESPSQ